MYFNYGEEEKEYLKGKDKKLCEVIEKIGHIKREIDPDLFSAIVHQIVAQQISTKAQATIWQRLNDTLGKINSQTILKTSDETLKSLGVSKRKIEYIKELAKKVNDKELDIQALWQKTDEQVISELIKLRGIGVWTAQMLLIFCMQRKNVFSYDDLGIQKGIKILYNHKKITKELFEKYKKRFSPYCSVASLYFWAVSEAQTDKTKNTSAQKNKQKYYKTQYLSPLGEYTLVSDGKNLLGVWLLGQKYYLEGILGEIVENNELEIFNKTKKWLDEYFNNKNPKISELKLNPKGSDFRQEVWKILRKIPYGTTISYGEIAKKIANKKGVKTFCAQAIGNAVGHNPISIIIPCHRVVGAKGSLCGYSCGIENKIKLLKFEGVNISNFHI